MKSLGAHTDAVTALAWLPDGSGFISGGLDQRIILWVGSVIHLEIRSSPDYVTNRMPMANSENPGG